MGALWCWSISAFLPTVLLAQMAGEQKCNYAPLYDLGGIVDAKPIQITPVNTVADCDQACCYFNTCTGYGFKAPSNLSDTGICYLYGAGEWWEIVRNFKEGESDNMVDYKRKMAEQYEASADDCPKGATCILNTQTDIFPLAFGDSCDDKPFFTQKEYIMETGKCIRGYGYSNILECVGPGRLLWSKFNSFDLDCSGELLAKDIFIHPELEAQCVRGLRALHYTFTWENFCLPESEVDEIDVDEKDLKKEGDQVGKEAEDDDEEFEKFVKCADIQSVESCFSESFCDWDWFKFSCVRVNLLINKFEDDRGIAKGCAADCKVDNARCQGKDKDGNPLTDNLIDGKMPLEEWDYGGLASCILEQAAAGKGSAQCTQCVRNGVMDGNFDFRCTYRKKKDCLMREWEECVWKSSKCLYKETKVDKTGQASHGRCKKKNGRATQCKKLEGCLWIPDDNKCIVDPLLDKGDGKCGTEVKLVKYGNAEKSGLPLKVDSACDCADSCAEYTVWKYKVKDGACTCYDPPKDTYLYVEELKPVRKDGEGKFIVNVDRACFVDCPWMVKIDG